jgi:hypothetical protein
MLSDVCWLQHSILDAQALFSGLKEKINSFGNSVVVQ